MIWETLDLLLCSMIYLCIAKERDDESLTDC
jgi:hypothetical protein